MKERQEHGNIYISRYKSGWRARYATQQTEKKRKKTSERKPREAWKHVGCTWSCLKSLWRLYVLFSSKWIQECFCKKKKKKEAITLCNQPWF
jgi:hypothetical protein